jgi:predicted RNase H-like HicB family nuclease
MKAEFTAIIEAAPEGGFWAICPEVPGANGQGETIEETKASLRQAIELILEDRKADILREGASHSLWINPKNGAMEAVPRHTEIKEPLAKKILKNLIAD